jgi:hypothetical protein
MGELKFFFGHNSTCTRHACPNILTMYLNATLAFFPKLKGMIKETRLICLLADTCKATVKKWRPLISILHQSSAESSR